MRKRLLFICLGNICRSPAAEGVMKKIIEESGAADRFLVDSAGIGGWHVGQLPDSRMRRHGARRGYRLDSRARQFSPADFQRFDGIYVMDHDNLRAILRMAQTEEERRKVHLLSDYFCQYKGRDVVPDPYYGGDADFELALDLIEDACQGLFQQLTRSDAGENAPRPVS